MPAAFEAPLAEVLRALAPVIAGRDELARKVVEAEAPEAAAAAGTSTMADPAVQAALKRLSQLLAEGDAGSVDVANQLLNEVADPSLAKVMREVSKALTDFDAAIAALSEVRLPT